MSGQESNLRLSIFRRLIDDRARNLGPVANRDACLARPLIVAIIALALAACAPIETRPPEVRTVTNTVLVPTVALCFKPEDVPKIPTPTPVDTATATIDQLAAAAAADLMALDNYAKIVDALFLACQKSTLEVKP